MPGSRALMDPPSTEAAHVTSVQLALFDAAASIAVLGSPRPTNFDLGMRAAAYGNQRNGTQRNLDCHHA